MSDDFDTKREILRKQAEARLAMASKPVENLSPEELKTLIHDHQVHQIELELQNEELRDAQKQLESARDRYAELFNNAPAGYLIIDQAGIIFQTNQTFAAMLGLEPHHLTGKPLADHMASANRSAFHGRFKAFFKNPTDKQLDFKLVGKAGEIEVRCTGRVENIHSGQQEEQAARHLLLVLNDVSTQARFERRQQLMARILAILNNPQDLANAINLILESIQQETGVDACGIRLRKGDDFPYYVHHGFSKGFLHQENTLLVRDAHGDVCRNAAGEPALECTCGLVLTGQTDPSNPLFTPAGSCWTNDSFPLLELPESQDPRLHPRNTCIHHGYQSVALVPVRANQEIVGLIQLNDHRQGLFDLDLIHFLEEISDSIGVALMRLQDTQMIKESEERLKALLNEKDKFFSIIAHDLKSPMSGLLSLSKMFAEDVESLTIKELQDVASAMHKSTERLYALLENLLQWALMQQGMMEYSPGAHGLRELVHAGIDSLRSVSEQKQVALQSRIPDDLVVLADAQMITTVVRNLVSNALKYSDTGGSVDIAATLEQGEVRVSVQDTGLGMDQHTRERVFSLDKKASRLGTQGESGTGLGLVLCKEFVKKHGGRIWAESEPGQGATFHFTVPAHG
jgi:PAS domain S-box-containing protein